MKPVINPTILFNHKFFKLGLLVLLLLLYLNVGPTRAHVDYESEILKTAEDWMGTPYKMGGTTKKGVDCSSFTQHIFNEVYGYELPRRVKNQKKLGIKIPKEEMRAGDLVVFKTGAFFTNQQHIGIYLSDNMFLHASSSEGVTVSSLEEWFWKKKYRSSRRIFDKRGKLVEIPENDKQSKKKK